MTEHAHHWLIETPNGTPYVTAKCRVCKEKRVYRAAFNDEQGINPRSAGYKAKDTVYDTRTVAL